MKNKIIDNRLSIIITFGIVLADQFTKFFARQNFTVIENSSLPFGVNFPGHLNLIIIAAALAAFIFFAWKYFGNQPGTGLIIGGALSNLVDRIIKTTVTDYINLAFSTINLADIAIYLGIIMLCFRKSTPRP